MRKLDLLKDACGDRQNPHMALPSAKSIPTERLFPDGENGRIDIDLLGQHLLREGKLAKKDFMTLLKRIDRIFDEEPNLLYLYDPITIVGDIHGQFYDLMHMFSLKKTGWENKKYLFLGDYVDRGMWSIEVLIYLYALKITYPKQIYLLRGNHESRECTANFNFRSESMFKYDQEVYEEVCETFDVLPLAAIVNGRFCCVHGGISPEIYKVSLLV
jgi:serine/threonine-protein phosphatase 2B catalytic subunit